MMKILLFYLSVILASAVLLNAQPYEAGDMVGDFSASICANGEGNLNLYDYYGDINGGDYNVIWLTFFASWWTNCQAEAPFTETIFQTYRDQGLQVIGIGFDWGYPYYCTDWAETFGPTYPLVDDTEYNLVELFGVPYVPHNVILDHTMTVQHSTYGFNENEIIATIEQLLEDLPEAEIEPEDEQQLVPGKLLLTTPYPNPFNSRTVISYFLPRSEVVTLSVYDTRGALVTILRNRERIPAGHHQKVWYADESPSGIYFVILETPSRRESAKVLYLK